ncbi:MAG: hypothetical protein F4069_06250 [Rhodothermaceae bacterium]|nr:hypothetical protein [Rhodothermaceae bacterium]MYG69714.1 hypothetical protein [Rhodothermaceae bacterium]MYJ44912.1 hypothetical protein [Rhodothermaceae bacterium]
MEPVLDQNSFEKRKRLKGNPIVEQHPQEWFEMSGFRNHPMSVNSWVTIKSIQTLPYEGSLLEEGHPQEIKNVGSVMFPITNHERVFNHGWDNEAYSCRFNGEIYNSKINYPSIELQEKTKDAYYLPCGYYYRDGLLGYGMVIEQHVNPQENPDWHLHQDFVVALNLIREGDKWVRPEEENIEVARLKRNRRGESEFLEVRKEHLLDYLSAREMNLYLYGFCSRRQLANDHSHINWELNKEYIEEDKMRRWAGRIIPMPPCELFPKNTTKKQSISFEDVNEGEKVPGPESKSARYQTSNIESEDNLIYMIIGDLWFTEVIEAGDRSKRVLGEESASMPFVIDSEGRTETSEFLKKSYSWLHFRPEIINVILGRRGASIGWLTSYTGWISLAPDHSVRFGVNNVSHINVLAKDVARLPVWQLKVWVGSNITPEEEVSSELLASQFEANLVDTIAPEVLFRNAYKNINRTSSEVLQKPLFPKHEYRDELFDKCHRFRAIERSGLYELAKDLYRLTFENVDQSALSAVVGFQKEYERRSIRHLQKVLEICRDAREAEKIAGSLKALNKLRQAGAHMPSSNIERWIREAGIIETGNPIKEAYQLLQHFAETLNKISEVLREAPIGQG